MDKDSKQIYSWYKAKKIGTSKDSDLTFPTNYKN